LESLVGGSNVGESVLVLDGFEQLQGPARSRAAELARIVTKAGHGQWKILVTVQPYQWIEVRQTLLDAGIAEVLRLDFADPNPREVLQKLETRRERVIQSERVAADPMQSRHTALGNPH